MTYIKWTKGCPYVYKGQDEYLGSYFKYRFGRGRKGLTYTDDIITTTAAKRKVALTWTPKMRSKIIEIDKLANSAFDKDVARRKKAKKK